MILKILEYLLELFVPFRRTHYALFKMIQSYKPEYPAGISGVLRKRLKRVEMERDLLAIVTGLVCKQQRLIGEVYQLIKANTDRIYCENAWSISHGGYYDWVKQLNQSKPLITANRISYGNCPTESDSSLVNCYAASFLLRKENPSNPKPASNIA